jgi:hypothetical protein
MNKKAVYYVTIDNTRISVKASDRFEALEKAEKKFSRFKNKENGT